MLAEISRLPVLKARGLSDLAIARLFGCCRRTVLNHRRRMGLGCVKWVKKTARALPPPVLDEAQLNRLWMELTLEQKARVLFQPYGRRTWRPPSGVIRAHDFGQ